MELINRFDDSVLLALNNWVGSSTLLTSIFRIIAQDFIYIVPILFIVWWFKPKWLGDKKDAKTVRQELIFIAVVGVFGWQVLSKLISMLWFRERPFSALLDAKELLFHRPSYAFPSDHALFLFTVASLLFILGYKKWGWNALWLAILISVARVAVAVHWPTDVIAGAALGYALALVSIKFKPSIVKYIADPLIGLAERVHLT